MNPDITKMSVIEIKSMVYDQLVLSEQCKQNIQVLNQELAKRSQPSTNGSKEIAVETVKEA